MQTLAAVFCPIKIWVYGWTDRRCFISPAEFFLIDFSKFCLKSYTKQNNVNLFFLWKLYCLVSRYHIFFLKNLPFFWKGLCYCFMYAVYAYVVSFISFVTKMDFKLFWCCCRFEENKYVRHILFFMSLPMNQLWE